MTVIKSQLYRLTAIESALYWGKRVETTFLPYWPEQRKARHIRYEFQQVMSLNMLGYTRELLNL